LNKRYQAAQGVLSIARDHNEAITIKLFEIWLVRCYNKNHPEFDVIWGSEDLDTDAEFIDSKWNLHDAVERLKYWKKKIYSDNAIQQLVLVETNSTKKRYYGIPYE